MTKNKNPKYDRLSLALRQNLSKRKEQKRSRSEAEETILEAAIKEKVAPDYSEKTCIPCLLEEKS